MHELFFAFNFWKKCTAMNYTGGNIRNVESSGSHHVTPLSPFPGVKCLMGWLHSRPFGMV